MHSSAVVKLKAEATIRLNEEESTWDFASYLIV